MTIPVQYPTSEIIVEKAIHNQTQSLFGDCLGKQWISGHHMISSHQQLENQLQELNDLLRYCNPCILSVVSSTSVEEEKAEFEPGHLTSEKVFD